MTKYKLIFGRDRLPYEKMTQRLLDHHPMVRTLAYSPSFGVFRNWSFSKVSILSVVSTLAWAVVMLSKSVVALIEELF